MEFLWPGSLLLLAAIPLLLLFYFIRQRRRRRYAVRYSSLALVRAALPAQSRLRRYLPMALFLLALASLAVGFARPITVTQVPAGRATVVLALDVSGSMNQDDIYPSRLVAAKQAALEFISDQKETNQIGLVAFAGLSQMVQAPTTNARDLEIAIRSLTTGRGTAIGSAIITALETIEEFGQNDGAAGSEPPPIPQTGSAQEQGYKPDIIVLLTDGNYNAGIDPFEAARQAVDNGVRVYTISFGTEAGSPRRNFGWPGNNFRRRFGIDEETLKTIAAMTGGEYYTANSAGQLQQVFDRLPTVLITREETQEVSAAFAALAALLVVGAVLLSQLWRPLP